MKREKFKAEQIVIMLREKSLQNVGGENIIRLDHTVLSATNRLFQKKYFALLSLRKWHNYWGKSKSIILIANARSKNTCF